MCFAIPKKIKEIDEKHIITIDGIRAKSGDLKLQKGEYVLIYGNMVVEKISSKNAHQYLKQIKAVDNIKMQ